MQNRIWGVTAKFADVAGEESCTESREQAPSLYSTAVRVAYSKAGGSPRIVVFVLERDGTAMKKKADFWHLRSRWQMMQHTMARLELRSDKPVCS
eukprot:scaffold134925_cov36-Prasinocladus_malaysianus.AAC.1